MSNKRELLITKPAFYTGGQQGCCGIGTIARLRSSYCRPACRDTARERWLTSSAPQPLLGDMPLWERMSMDKIITWATSDMPTANIWGANKSYTSSWYGMAVSQNMAYVSVLDSLHTHNRYSIYFMSDNLDDRGDCHIGPFTTRGFAAWLQIQQLGAIHTSGPIVSLKTERNLQGWIFVPNWGLIKQIIEKQRELLINGIKELNNDERIKSAAQDRRKARELKNKQLQSSFCEGWTS